MLYCNWDLKIESSATPNYIYKSIAMTLTQWSTKEPNTVYKDQGKHHLLFVGMLKYKV